jgi:hypothetical protein
MNIYEQFASDGLIDEAKTFPLSESAEITMLPTGGEKARRAFEKMMEPYGPRLNAGGKLTDEENKKLNARFYAEYIVKGWKGIKGKDNEEITFSKENALALFTDEKLAGFFALIIRMSQNDEGFKAAAEATDEGNS